MSQPQPTYVYLENGLLPPDLKAQLSNWPASGSGTRDVHRHIVTLANRLRHYVPAEQAVGLIKAGSHDAPKAAKWRRRLIGLMTSKAFRKRTGLGSDS